MVLILLTEAYTFSFKAHFKIVLAIVNIFAQLSLRCRSGLWQKTSVGRTESPSLNIWILKKWCNCWCHRSQRTLYRYWMWSVWHPADSHNTHARAQRGAATHLDVGGAACSPVSPWRWSLRPSGPVWWGRRWFAGLKVTNTDALHIKKIAISSDAQKLAHNSSASPWGSTFLASWSASELVRSLVAGMTAKMRQFSLHTYRMIMSRIWYSMSLGWSPTGSLVIPGRSTRVRFSTGQRQHATVFEGEGRFLDVRWAHSQQFTIWRVNLQVDGDRWDALVGASESVGLPADLPADLAEVRVLFSPRVEKLAIFWEDGTMGNKKEAFVGPKDKNHNLLWLFRSNMDNVNWFNISKNKEYVNMNTTVVLLHHSRWRYCFC